MTDSRVYKQTLFILSPAPPYYRDFKIASSVGNSLLAPIAFLNLLLTLLMIFVVNIVNKFDNIFSKL